MSRSGYSEDYDGPELALYRGQVMSTIRGKNGQAFLKELAVAMDAMPIKELITDELVRADGQVCTLGVVCKTRGIDVSELDIEDPHMIGRELGITWQLAAEIEFMNDEGNWAKTPAERWAYMRKWIDRHITEAAPDTRPA